MKYNFNFIQVANWVYVIRTRLKQLRERLDREKISKNEALMLLEAQKQHLQLIKDIIKKNTKLLGIQKDFLKNFKKIKEEYGIRE